MLIQVIQAKYTDRFCLRRLPDGTTSNFFDAFLPEIGEHDVPLVHIIWLGLTCAETANEFHYSKFAITPADSD